MLNLIPAAHAESTSGILGSFDLMSLMPLVFIFVAFYFFMIRPQQKKMQTQRDMLNAVSRGDQVVTAGGIIGTVVKVISESEVLLEVANNVYVRLVRGMITENLTSKSQGIAKAQTGLTKVSMSQKLMSMKKKPTPIAKKFTSTVKKSASPVKKPKIIKRKAASSPKKASSKK
jgi:preprotein translocase subunit YajC